MASRSPKSSTDTPQAEMHARRDRLREAIGSLIAGEWPPRRDDDEFNRIALEVFRYQAEANPVYGSFVSNRGVDPRAVADFREIPSVPAGAFKEVPLVCRDPRPIEATFRTTGTTRGRSRRGEHHVRDLSLYRASLLSTAGHFLRPDTPRLADNRSRIRILSLTPRPSDRPESSLVFMIGAWMEAWDDGVGGFFADSEWRIDVEAVDRALRAASREASRTLVVGTAFSFVHWLDRARPSIDLPEGSLVVETGGFKGMSRSVEREDLYEGLCGRLSVPMGRIVNEYGMTEMLSQFYEPTLLIGEPVQPRERWHVGPPWVRTRILDPATLAPAAEGQPGLLCHLDLANLDSVAAILTEDLGVEVEGGFRLLGRSQGAEARGCSLAMEEFLAVTEPFGRA